MKFSVTAAITALAFSTASSAYLLPRHVDTDQNATSANNVDFGTINGTWFLTGITANVWSAYQAISQTFGLEIDCLHFNVSAPSNASLEVDISAFLNKTSANIGVNATAAAVLGLQSDASVNASAYEFSWDTYGSQVFVNKAQWDNSSGQASANASEGGSVVVAGTKPFQLTLYSKLIDSHAQHGSNESTTHFDTIFLWGSQVKMMDENNSKRTEGDAVYGALLSKTPLVDEEMFNRTIALLPQSIASSNVSIVKLNNTCDASS